jgi:uncharacterized membrane protein
MGTADPQAILIPSLGVEMPEASSTQTQARAPRLTLNTDGQRHPVLNALTAFTFLAGCAAFASALVVRLHLAATILGLTAFGIGLLAQMMSATREERIFIVAGIIAGGVGMGLGIAHGGFG